MSLLQSANESDNDAIPADGIFRAAKQCRQLFQDTTEACTLDEKVIDRIERLSRSPSLRQSTLTCDDLADEFKQFRVWARNLGVFAPDQTSLDYRLREAQDVKSGIMTLLESLRRDLDALWYLIYNDRGTETQEDSSSSSEMTESSSDESDLQDAAGRTAYELHARLQRINSTTSKLMQIAEVIRASNPSARAARSASYVHYEGEINVTEQFEKEYLPLVLEHRYKLKASLINRFVTAISLRRRRFLYQAKHQQRLAYSGEYDEHSLRQSALSNSRKMLTGSLPHMQPRALPKTSSQKGLSQSNILTVATSFNKLQPRKTAPSTIVSATTKATFADFEIPPPPPIAERASHFECPYCCILLPKRKFLAGKGNFNVHLWNKHVLADLQPYACLEDDCLTPNLQLETREEWLNHQKWEHMMEWWCEGNASHEPTKFITADKYVEHIQREHSQSYQLASKQASTAGRPSMTPFNACPFCDFDALEKSGANEAGPKGQRRNLAESLDTQNSLQNHICNELIHIFLIALPERHDIKDIDTETGRPAAKGSTVRALDDITLSFLDENDRGQTPAGSDQFPLEFELSDSPYDVQIEAPSVGSWDDIWESPQLQECVRSTYTGLENDPHIQEMVAIAMKDDTSEIPLEKWIPTLLLQTEEDEEPWVLVIGRRVPDDVKGYGIDLLEDLNGYAATDPELEMHRPRRRSLSSKTEEIVSTMTEDGKTNWAEFFVPPEIRIGNEQRDDQLVID